MVWDRAQLERFRDGDPSTLGDVYRNHAGALARLVRAAAFRGATFAALRSAVELENTLVETFARAFEPRARQAYDGIRPYEQFLMGIARNVVFERFRSREDAAGLELEDALHASPLAEDTGLEVVLEDREVAELLHRFRAALSVEDGQLYDARFNEGLGQEAAATRMGLTRIQIRRREQKLRQRLLEYLQTHGYLGDLAVRGWSFVKESA